MQVMRRMRGRFVASAGVLAALLALCGTTATPASADSFTDTIAVRMAASHVYVDPSVAGIVTPPAASQLSSQLLATRKNLYLVELSPAQVSATNSTSLLAAIHNSLGVHTSEIIGIVTTRGLYTGAFNLPGSVSFGASSATNQISSTTRPGTNQVIVSGQWIGAMATLQGSPVYVSTTPVRTATHKVNAAVIFIVIGGFLALIAIGVGSYLFFRSRRLKRERAEAEQQKREQNQRDRQRYQSRISDLTTMLGTIEVGAKITPRATVHYSTALAALSHAQTSLDNDDFEETAKYLRQANAFYERAESLINGGSDPVADTQYATRPGTDNVPSTPRTAGRPDISGISQQTSTTSSNTVNARFRHPQTQEIIVISDPMPVYSVRYPYEWGGGMVGNKFLPPGFYPYEVWDTNAGWGDPITNLLVAEQLGEISVANREAYETGLVAGSMGTVSGGDYGGSTYVDPGVTPDNIVPDISSGGDYGTSGNTVVVSGGDYGSTPSYVDPDPPTYDPGPSYTDNNYGGGDYS